MVWLCDATAAVDGVLTATDGALHPGDDGALQGVFSPAGVLHPRGCGDL